MSQQKVFRIPSKGAGYEALQEKTESIPQIEPHQVLLRVQAVSLNFRDIAISTGIYPFLVKDEVVPVSDASGIIEQVGSAVVGLQTGDWAIANFDPTNLYGPQKGNKNYCGMIGSRRQTY